MQFEWDKGKNQANKKKHGISFELACFIFEDPFILSIPDNRFDYSEERWRSLGLIRGVLQIPSKVPDYKSTKINPSVSVFL